MKIQDGVVVLAALLGSTTGCGSEPEADANDSSTASDHVEKEPAESARRGKTQVAALALNCSDENARFLHNLAFYAGTAIIEALGNLDYEGSELALRYFGEGHDQEAVRNVLQRMINVAWSDKLTLVCESNEPEGGEEHCANSGAVLWTSSTAWQTGDWTIHVCGDRFWDAQWVSGEDSDNGASQLGILVHELAHLGGAWMEGDATYGEAFVLELAQGAPFFSPYYAEPFRFYVMQQNK